MRVGGSHCVRSGLQPSAADWSSNGLAREQATSNGAGAVTESHQVAYLDDAGVYVNGNRTSDHYV